VYIIRDIASPRPRRFFVIEQGPPSRSQCACASAGPGRPSPDERRRVELGVPGVERLVEPGASARSKSPPARLDPVRTSTRTRALTREGGPCSITKNLRGLGLLYRVLYTQGRLRHIASCTRSFGSAVALIIVATRMAGLRTGLPRVLDTPQGQCCRRLEQHLARLDTQ